MNEPYDSQTANPSIEKYVVASNNGIETHKFTRCVIGYILHGEKYVYYDDKCYKFSQGDLFFLGMYNRQNQMRRNSEPDATFRWSS